MQQIQVGGVPWDGLGRVAMPLYRNALFADDHSRNCQQARAVAIRRGRVVQLIAVSHGGSNGTTLQFYLP